MKYANFLICDGSYTFLLPFNSYFIFYYNVTWDFYFQFVISIFVQSTLISQLLLIFNNWTEFGWKLPKPLQEFHVEGCIVFYQAVLWCMVGYYTLCCYMKFAIDPHQLLYGVLLPFRTTHLVNWLTVRTLFLSLVWQIVTEVF